MSSLSSGVCYCKTKHKYYAYFNFNGERINLGSYNKIEDAVNIRQDCEIYFNKVMSTIHKDWVFK